MSSKDPSARLHGIFQDTSVSGGGNDALRYTAPREPSHQQQQQQQVSASPAAASTPSSVVYSTMVSLYRYDPTTRTFVQQGGTTTGKKAAVGCVIVGSNTSYNLLFYNAVKQHLCAVPITLATFQPSLQAKSYVNFYDEKGVNWSVKFATDDQLVAFMRQVFLAKIHVEIWGPDKTVTKTNPRALIQDDLVFVTPEAQPVSIRDTVAVAFRAWRVVGNASSAPGDVVTKYAPFETAGERDLRKIRLGDSTERIKALEESVVGMKKGGKRMVLVPPGKTNGQDWYLLEIELLKTKTGHGSTQKKTVPAATGISDATEDAADASSGQKASRRRLSPSSTSKTGEKTTSSNSNSSHSPLARNNKAGNGDLVPYDEESTAAKRDMQLKELRLLQREQQLELQMRALERDRINAAGGGGGFGSMGCGFGGGFHSSVLGASALLDSSARGGGRPVDTVLSEINAKVDYLIRMAPGTSLNAGYGIGAGPSDVAAVLRGVERLAGENDRLLTQINSQHQQQSSYEKRCEELLEQNTRLQEEKRTLQERFQSAASSQLNATSELASLASARDAAVTQTSRLHAEYQQLLTAYYQLQQQQGSSNETEGHKQALIFEREARSRAEKELARETQTRSLAEQELALSKKQHDVTLQLKASELSTATAELEQHVRSLQAQLQKANDEMLQLQAHAEEQTRQLAAQSETKERDGKEQLEKAALQAAQLQQENGDIVGRIDASSARIHELEMELASKVATDSTANNALAADEKWHFVEQIELLHQQIKAMEQKKFEQVQEALANGRSQGLEKGVEGECKKCAAVREREQAAEHALATAEAIKCEAQDMLATATHAGGSAEEREKLMALFKESVNEMFFRFQDLFEEETAVDGKQVLTAIRKVLKSSTKSIMQRLQESPRVQIDVKSDGNMSDGLPAPLQQDTAAFQSDVAAATAVESVDAVEVAYASSGEELREVTEGKSNIATIAAIAAGDEEGPSASASEAETETADVTPAVLSSATFRAAP